MPSCQCYFVAFEIKISLVVFFCEVCMMHSLAFLSGMYSMSWNGVDVGTLIWGF